MYCSSILKYIYIYIFIHFFPQNFSLLYLIISVLFSLFLLCFSICSLLSSDPNTILPSLWLLFFFFLGVGDGVGQWWLWFLAWVTMVVVVFFFFLGCDRCLKGLLVVVGSGVWVVAEVGCWSWIGEASHGLSLISSWIGELGLDRWAGIG